MQFRLAVREDLPQIQSVYRQIIKNMYDNRIEIWDEIYPCDFFEEDIKQNRLYVLLDDEVVVSAFALCDSHAGAGSVGWEMDTANALYLDRLGVHVKYARKGIGIFMLAKAKETAKSLGAGYLRLFVVDINEPAVSLYQKNGFQRASGIYDECIEEDLILHEYGYETKL